MYSTIFWFTLILGYVSSVIGQTSSCTTPSGRKGQCVTIYECEVLLKLVQNTNRSQQDLQLLQNSKCGYVGETIMVCCPPECETPEGIVGKCVNIDACPHLANRLRPPVNALDQLYVQQSKCEGWDPNRVCCGPAPRSRPVVPAANNINAICTAKQSAFPPAPDSECCGYDSRIGNKIIGGNATGIDMYPWMVLIGYDIFSTGNNLLCGGVLISARYVLTAAHCIGEQARNTVGNPAFVRLGEYDTSNPGKDCIEVEAGGMDCTDGEVDIKIEKLMTHPEYLPSTGRNDIGLIRLEKNAPFTDFIRPICLPTYDITLNPPPPENFTLYAAGWGATENLTGSNVKLHTALPFVELTECQKSYNGPQLKIDLWEHHMCAGGQRGKDTCKGDSGGPVMYENGRIYEVLGIINFGPKPCAQQGMPGVNAKVFAYKDWILSKIQN